MRLVTLLLLLATGAAHAQGTALPPAVRYELRLTSASDSLLRVTMQLTEPRSAVTDFAMPRAIPMGYGTQPYDRFVESLVARTPGGATIPMQDIEGPRWRIAAAPDAPLARLEYAVNLRRMERDILNAGDASRLRPGYLGLLGYSVLGFVAGLETRPVTVSLHVPRGWPILSTRSPMRSASDSVHDEGTDYYAIADAQYMAGPSLQVKRVDSAVPLAVAVYAEDDSDVEAMVDASDRAVRLTTAWFGTPMAPHFTTTFEMLRPLSRAHTYRFSMEHLESATFRLGAGDFVLDAMGRERFLYNVLHHVSHAWIPKRCAPAGYYPFTWDWSEGIDMIWFSEGWAQYAAADMLAGDGPDAASRRRQIAGRRFDAAANDSAPPLNGRSTADLSRIAAHQYSDDFRVAQTVFSRGGRMAEAIDERVRRETGGTRRFRDIARGLVTWCATANRPVTIDDIVQVASQATGVQVRDIIDSWLAPRGTVPAGRPRP